MKINKTARKIIIVVIAALIVFIGVKGKQMLADSKPQPKTRVVDNTITVFTQAANLTTVPIQIQGSGVLQAKERLELFSEAQGVMLPDGGRFKEGVSFRTGAVLVSINATDVKAQLVAQRSSFQRLLTTIMADLKLDYAEDFETWSSYLSNINVNQKLQALPAVSSEKLKLFLTGRSVYTEFYNIKNSEIKLAKYTIRAPYNGILTEANVDPGTVIRPGQKLGVFIKPNSYELKVALESSMVDKLRVGQQASLVLDKNSGKTFNGTITRINRTVNSQSQLSSVFIKTNSPELKDGMFLHATMEADAIDNVMEVSRSMLFNENKVYLVKDSILVEHPIKIHHITQKTAVISGVKSGDQILSKIPPLAFPGMKVKIYKDSSTL